MMYSWCLLSTLELDQNSPDKNPGVKAIHERFARLGVVSSILRKKESRQRYDFFYKNGVPKWRGTGYYYSRFRPGLGVSPLLRLSNRRSSNIYSMAAVGPRVFNNAHFRATISCSAHELQT
jgi:curved DNA-binding protein CbpA